jgi:hypothetical protein
MKGWSQLADKIAGLPITVSSSFFSATTSNAWKLHGSCGDSERFGAQNGVDLQRRKALDQDMTPSSFEITVLHSGVAVFALPSFRARPKMVRGFP